jgi:transcriptional regulator GlxA family with amidase domain
LTGRIWRNCSASADAVRLDAATGLLRDTALPAALIAANVGYTPEAAFSRAFKRR